MKQALYYLEKGRFTILNLGYDFIAFKSSIKKAVKIRFKGSFQKVNIRQSLLD